jgi:uncharacterized protein (TIGR02147 family)
MPLIYDYLDFRAFLKDWFDARKAANPRFSHRAFVRRTGRKSPSLLADIIAARRSVPKALAHDLSDAMGLKLDESAFFMALVDFEQASTAAEKNRAWQRIASSRRFKQARRLDGEAFRFLTHWYYPAIHEMAAMPDFDADPTLISRRLRPRITPTEAAQALRCMRELGLLAEDEGGRLRQTDRTVTTPREAVGLAAFNYHFGMLGLAQEALETVDHDQRHFVGLTLAIPSSKTPELKQLMAETADRLCELADGADGDRDRVVQVNLNFFPLTEEVM